MHVEQLTMDTLLDLDPAELVTAASRNLTNQLAAIDRFIADMERDLAKALSDRDDVEARLQAVTAALAELTTGAEPATQVAPAPAATEPAPKLELVRPRKPRPAPAPGPATSPAAAPVVGAKRRGRKPAFDVAAYAEVANAAIAAGDDPLKALRAWSGKPARAIQNAMRTLRSNGLITAHAPASSGTKVSTMAATGSGSPPPAAARVRAARKAAVDYQKVAEVVIAARRAGLLPLKALQDWSGKPESTVAGWLKRATSLGLIPADRTPIPKITPDQPATPPKMPALDAVAAAYTTSRGASKSSAIAVIGLARAAGLLPPRDEPQVPGVLPPGRVVPRHGSAL